MNKQKLIERIEKAIDEVTLDYKRIHLHRYEDIDVDEYGTIICEITGGLNGPGRWESYFAQLSNFINQVKDHNIDIWLIRLVNDCPDDVFYATFGVDNYE